VQADLRDAKAAANIIPVLAKKDVTPDCLINNASAFEKDALATLTPEEFHARMDVNLLAPLLLMQGFVAHYKGSEGNIINITDGMSGWSMSHTFLSYALSKNSLKDATRMLARDLAPTIRVNSIAPGATLEGKQDKKDTFNKLRKIIPLGRTSSPEEINLAVHYILSSPSLTGQILSLSGGMDLN
jgi:NAD(P)-dependent dehydrogenase (short-subunit alcohol dehydrogenase family)